MPNTTSKNVIHLLGQPVYNELGVATVAITPGMIVEGVQELAPNSVADQKVAVAVALEREEMGLSIDDDYAVGDTVKVGVYFKGSRFLGILASGESVDSGDYLDTVAGGKLAAGGVATAIGRSHETLEATAGDARIVVEVV